MPEPLGGSLYPHPEPPPPVGSVIGGLAVSVLTGTPTTSGGISSSGLTPRTTLESVAQTARDAQLQTAGDREILPIVYGQTRIGAKIATAIDYNGDLVLLCVWGYGPFEAVDQIYIGSVAAPAAVTITTYLGQWGDPGPGVGVDPTLASAFSAKGLSYTDNLWCVCYSVVRVPPNTVDGFPQVTARVKGRKVYDWRDVTQDLFTKSSWKWTDNPVCCLFDALYNSDYSGGIGPNFPTAAADDCDSTLGGKKKRTLNLVIDQQSDLKTWIATLRTYAGCWVRPNGGGGVDIVPDTTGSSVFSFTASNIVSGSLRLRKRSNRNAPNMVEVLYTDTTVIPYRDAAATSPQFGTGPIRLSQIRLPGINNHEQAYREAVERVNDLNLNDLEGEFVSFDTAFAAQEGDIVDITHPIGLSAKLVRVTKAVMAEPGRYRIQFKEYDPAKYSSAVVAGPSYVDTQLPTVTSVPPPYGPGILEEVYQVEAYGGYASRIRITWLEPFPTRYTLVDHYHVDVLAGSDVIWTGDVLPKIGVMQFRTGAVKEGVLYTINIYTISTFGTKSTPATTSVTPQGKQLPPGDVPALRGFEAGGKVFLSWDPAADIDIWKYELRYASTNSWAAGILIDKVSNLTYAAQTVPPGTWYILIKAIDSVGNYSTNAVSKQITVTLDNNAYLVDSYTFTSPSLQYMTQWSQRAEANPYFTTDFGDGVGYGADNTNNSTGIFGDSLVNVPLASPHSSGTTTGTSQWTSEAWDATLPLAGTWQANVAITDHVGTSTTVIETSTAASTGPWSTGTGTSAQLNGRWARMRVFGTGAFTVRGNPSIQVSVVPRREVGSVNTLSTALVRVTLQNRYVYARSIQVTPSGTGARFAVVDNVVVGTGAANTFDVYAFNDAGAQVAAPVYWTFEGVS